jgi:hypothetical protein
MIFSALPERFRGVCGVQAALGRGAAAIGSLLSGMGGTALPLLFKNNNKAGEVNLSKVVFYGVAGCLGM